jgi:hypothetical protein
MMDGQYKNLSMRVSWTLTHGTIVDTNRNHESDFEAFADAVKMNLRSSGNLSWQSTGGEFDKYRDITFLSDRPIEQADWAQAIGDAALSCCVLSDQRDWSFE